MSRYTEEDFREIIRNGKKEVKKAHKGMGKHIKFSSDIFFNFEDNDNNHLTIGYFIHKEPNPFELHYLYIPIKKKKA